MAVFDEEFADDEDALFRALANWFDESGPRVVMATTYTSTIDQLEAFLARFDPATHLLIVGGEDTVVIELNRQAMARLGGGKRLEIVAGATHLFEEPGALDQVAALARDWFTTHLRRNSS
jgi:pimeloyl-ACP methyl ester carboxylesterase